MKYIVAALLAFAAGLCFNAVIPPEVVLEFWDYILIMIGIGCFYYSGVVMEKDWK